MNRLTKRTANGLAYTDIPLNNSSILDDSGQICDCYMGFVADRLAAYEDTGFEPEHIDDIVGQLLGYLDAEQAGLLIKLPCKVGTQVWIVHHPARSFPSLECIPFSIALYNLVGKTVFLTREEAEKALGETK